MQISEFYCLIINLRYYKKYLSATISVLIGFVALPYKSRDFIYKHVGCVVSAIISDTLNWLIEKQNKRKQRSICLLQYPSCSYLVALPYTLAVKSDEIFTF